MSDDPIRKIVDLVLNNVTVNSRVIASQHSNNVSYPKVEVHEISNIQNSVLSTDINTDIGLSNFSNYDSNTTHNQSDVLKEAAQHMVDAWESSEQDDMECAIANLTNALAGKPLVYKTIAEVPSKIKSELTISDSSQERYKQGIQAAVTWLQAYAETIPVARLVPSLSFIANKMAKELLANDKTKTDYNIFVELADVWEASIAREINPCCREVIREKVDGLRMVIDLKLSPTLSQICQECDPPGSGKECRGGTCYKCQGLGTIQIKE